MGSRSRKFYIGFMSLAVVLVIYLTYTILSEGSQVDLATRRAVGGGGRTDKAQKGVGQVEGVSVETVEKAVFIDRKEKTREIERIFGFDRVLHDDGGFWEIEKPYMNIFMSDFRCNVTADRGRVRVESAEKRSTPKDVKLMGNVLIHILPRGAGGFGETFIRLDDVFVLSEKSRVTSSGPLRLDSPDAQMLGRGLELVYNSQADRLEYLRITSLQSLGLKSAGAALFGRDKAKKSESVDVTGDMQGARVENQMSLDSSREGRLTANSLQPAALRENGRLYRWVFDKNVLIDTPEQLLSAADQVSINNIFWKSSTAEKTFDVNVGDDAEPNTASYIDPNAVPAAVTEPAVPNQPAEQDFDVTVTCDNGLLITLADSARSIDDFVAAPEAAHSAHGGPDRLLSDTRHRARLAGERIDYCAATGETLVTGPVRLAFDVNDPMDGEPDKPAIPVTLTAQKAARFIPASNKVVFDGDCRCKAVREDANGTKTYMLTSPMLELDLIKADSGEPSGLGFNISHLTASGGRAALATTTTVGERLVGGIELACRQIDFDADGQMLLAAGPGQIRLDNSRAAQRSRRDPNAEPNIFSLKKPCWAVVDKFQTLKFFADENLFVADAAPMDYLLVNYFPIVDANIRYDQQATATAGHVEALLEKTEEGDLELSTLNASGGVTYADEGRKQDLQGETLFFDFRKSLITVEGRPGEPCLLNGAGV
ncbi:MAG: LptA/OstA family protein, partial [Planctomycetota bacterium]